MWGGLLTGWLGWKAIFFINVPVGVAGLIGMLRAPRSPRREAPVDLAGQVTSVLAGRVDLRGDRGRCCSRSPRS